MDTVTTILAAVAGVSTVVTSAIAVLWNSEKNAQKQLIDSLKSQALSSETRAIASDARAVAAETRFTRLVSEFKLNVVALNKASVAFDPGALVGSVPPPPGVEEPTGVYFAEGRRARAVILDDREEFERRRQQPLNPDAERREAERREKVRVDALQRRYLEEQDSDRPPRGRR